jgi:carbamoyltransferase
MTIRVLGMGLSHDASAVLLSDGRPVAGVQLERLTRRKHDDSLLRAPEMIRYVLDTAGLGVNDLDLVVAHGKSWLDSSDLRVGPLDLSAANVVHLSHHLAHAASAFGPSPFDSAAVLVVDGHGDAHYDDLFDWALDGPAFARALDDDVTGDDLAKAPRWETESLYRFDRHALELVERRTMSFGRHRVGDARWGDSLGIGLHYGDVAEWLFGSRRAAGKVMGLAPYGMLRSTDEPLHRIEASGPVPLERWKVAIKRQRESEKTSVEAEWLGWRADVAARVQRSTEEMMLHLARRAHELVSEAELCLAGGVALNAPTNSRISRETPFSSMFVQPASTDAGLSLGCAVYGDFLVGGRFRGEQRVSDDLGRTYSSVEIEAAIRTHHEFVLAEKINDAAESVANLLADGAVIGWFHGGSEFGPRALGHRSILADPRRPEVREHLNIRVKRREWFRPFAPAVLEEHAETWFHQAGRNRHMLFTSLVRESRRGLVPAVAHVDGTARLQTVPASRDVYRRLIEAFSRITGVPLVLNTSFNCHDEPIVETPTDALDAFVRMPVGYLSIGPYLVSKRSHVEACASTSEVRYSEIRDWSTLSTLPIELASELAAAVTRGGDTFHNVMARSGLASPGSAARYIHGLEALAQLHSQGAVA